MKKQIYLDNNATTFVDPRVAAAIYEHLNTPLGNPSSVHSFGRSARAILQEARRAVAQYIGAKPQEVIFTSGGTEAINMVVRGALDPKIKGHIISSSVEHSCVHSTLQQIQSDGWDVSFLQPGLWGAITPDAVEKAIRSNTRLIVLMAVNNETGVKTDIEGIAEIARREKIPFIVDGVALLGKEPILIPSGVSSMCFSGHKIHAPAGVGFCFVRHHLKLQALLTGGDQEFQRRGGTENLSGIVGLAEAIRILQEELPEASSRMVRLRDRMESEILDKFKGSSINGKGPRVSNTSNISFEGVDGEALLTALDMEGVAVSHGSACSSGALEPSRVLLNMGISRASARSSLRLSLSRFTTDDEIEAAIGVIAKVVSRLYRPDHSAC